MNNKEAFARWFRQATEREPYPFQIRFACEPTLPELVDVPTGMGKTAMAVLGWLWRRRFAEETVQKATPRRLVYCLPMRVLVEQTVESAQTWLKNLELLTELREGEVSVHTFMGGDIDNDWDAYPEANAILIGTQDQLLSRALNRGYAMSRYRWPMHYALLNNDCLWIMDEVQLMGVGLTTTAQLQAFREKFGTFGPAQSVWMSATPKTDTLGTVDFAERAKNLPRLSLIADDVEHSDIARRVKSVKLLHKAETIWTQGSEGEYPKRLAEEVCRHHQSGTLTVVMVNRVGRAQDVFVELQRQLKGVPNQPEPCLIHSRFRQAERVHLQQRLKEKPEHGRIVVATQAIEAGVDISARTLFTELAPWSSLVQRFGRCNRYGEWEPKNAAHVFWIDLETALVDKKGEQQLVPEAALPYEIDDLDWSRGQLNYLKEVGPSKVSKITAPKKDEVGYVLRRRDVVDLFDTTPDLAGNDIDVSRYIRDGENNDVQVYWRQWDGGKPSADMPALRPEELCAVAIGRIKEFLKKDVLAFRWDGLERHWLPVKKDNVWSGLTILLHVSEGGYAEDLGWTGKNDGAVPAVPLLPELPSNDALDEDRFTFIHRFVHLTEHATDVAQEMKSLKTTLDDPTLTIPWSELFTAARWHDVGKAHEVFQKMLTNPLLPNNPRKSGGPWAKSDHKKGRPDRKHFRHELASALALLLHKESDLAAYLAAAHHGKVRLSIRSLPDEEVPPEVRRFARGVWEGDQLPAVDLGDEISTQAVTLTLSFMEMGEGPHGPSWLERMLRLRDHYGPFRLAWMETLVRVADWRGTAKEGGVNA
ncbi:CRISPR-associated helicase, Cas3 family [Candidatus Nitrospira nitrosa]|uniref:CRISPR-associated helicase, Cas3 family n=1 Tax=Candidatus Nitrospira nitrosa TaxID=1742972 RepID=A0A0S4LTL7_9BACT|nr:CRISPR-associated helicase/endonuclease Cas3 [Candidatus Nitrospira nitrosa]CUS38386.1 CRISPR-associated helicase, Cas3 family [Candidatus Nitrospira nitrosa]